MAVGFLLFLLLRTIALSLGDVAPFVNNQAYQQGELGPYPRQNFFSDREIIAPVANIIVEQQDGISSARYVTWAAHGENITTVPQLLDAETLSVVYQGPQYAEDTFGFTVQSCNNSDYLVWWAGTNIDGRAAGSIYILNSTYHLLWNVSSIGLDYADAHDVYLTPDCHVIFTAYQARSFDLHEYGGVDFELNETSWLLDSYFQEIELTTNELVFQWRASDHIDLHDSFWLAEIESQGKEDWHGWDFFHINSVQKDHKGNFLISARHTCAIYYIDGITGSTIWTLGGGRNEFLDLDGGRATDFSWQHDARWIDNSLTSISLFDDRSCGYFQAEDPTSRGIIIDLDFENSTAQLAAEYRAPSNIAALRKGGMHYLDNGNVLVGFGSEPACTEFAPNGTILWDIRLGPVMKDIDRLTADNYRAYKLDWVGEPYWTPKIAPGPSFNRMPLPLFNANYEDLYADLVNDTAYFSWNGATRLAKWMVLAGHDPTKVISMKSILAQMDKIDFETSAYVGNNGPYVCAIAFDQDDNILGVTPLLHIETGMSMAIEDTAGLLHNQYTKFRNNWQRSRGIGLIAYKAISLVVISLVMVLAIFAWCRRDALDRVLSKLLLRNRYEPVAPGDELEQQIPSGGWNFSATTAVDPATALMLHDIASDEQDTEQGVGERRSHLA